MVADWYCVIDDRQFGPITAVQLKQLATTGKLQPAHLVWKEGMQKRVPAQSVKGLFGTAGEAGKRPGSARNEGPAEVEPIEVIPEPEEVEPVELDDIEVEVQEADEEEVPKPREKSAKPEQEPAELVAEVSATYRGGHPDLDRSLAGALMLETTGFRFVYKEEEEEDQFRLGFDKVENVLEPAKGDFPEAMKRKALGAKVAGKVGGLASGMVGNLLGNALGKTGGQMAASATKQASKMAEESGNLGKPPRNRITVIALFRKKRCKVFFDVHGGQTGNEMTEEAKIFFKQIQKTRQKNNQDEPAPTTNSVVRSAPAAAVPPAGKPYRISSGGKVQGFFSLREIRQFLRSGKLQAGDLIGVETWIPVATLGGLLGEGGPAGQRKGGPGAGAAATEEEEDAYDAVVDEDDEAAEEAEEDLDDEEATVAEDDEGDDPPAKEEPEQDAVSVDQEFQLD